jgi:hypothetical protein
MRSTWFVLAALVGCGDNLPANSGFFEIVGHSDLGARGMSSALAVAGDTVYVGSRIDNQGIEIVDVSNPAAPTVVGEIPGLVGMSSRELRAVPDLNLLVVLSLRCDPMLHGCATAGGEAEGIKLYDISDRHAPVLTATYPISGTQRRPRSPHEFYLRFDGTRALLFVAAPPAPPALEVVDVTDVHAPKQVVQWDPSQAGLVSSGSADDILHSVAVSLDGTQLYLSHQLGGLLVADITAMPAISLVTPPAAALDWAPPGAMGPHSTVEVPGRPVLLVTEEVYAPPYGQGCPWGKLRTVDNSNPAAPVVLAEIGVAENDTQCAATAQPGVVFTAHNVTATQNLALVTWYAGGLQAIDIADAAAPRILGELRPEPLPSVTHEDPGLGGSPIEMWSYPVVQDGLVYVVDVRNGLYILRYHGLWEEQVAAESFLEGNSNL